ncbi:MAG TPA: hypothetical protein VLW85_05750 [Myxococcales bacterium]|nr:hypothetical protein [Myxococcales bacterium]
MRRLLLIALLTSACHFYRAPAYSYQVIRDDDVEDLDADASEQLRCPDDQIDSRQLTLLTRLVTGCGHQRVYAWDPLREQWIVASVEQP